MTDEKPIVEAARELRRDLQNWGLVDDPRDSPGRLDRIIQAALAAARAEGAQEAREKIAADLSECVVTRKLAERIKRGELG